MKLISTTLLDELAVKATSSPRRRVHHNLHTSPTDSLQRFIIVAVRGSYVRPHRHWTKSELVTVIRGRFEMVLFDDGGHVTAQVPWVIGDGEGEAKRGFRVQLCGHNTAVEGLW